MSILFCYTFQTGFLDFTFSGGLRSSCLGGMVAGMAIRTGRAAGTGKMTGGSPERGWSSQAWRAQGPEQSSWRSGRGFTRPGTDTGSTKGKGRVVSRIREENFQKKGRAVKTDKEFLDMLKSSHRDEKQCARSA